MNTKKLLTTLILSTILLTGCGFKNKNVIITVNNQKITEEDFNTALNTLTNNNIPAPKSYLYLTLKDRVVNELVVRKLLEQEIEKRKIVITDDEQEEALTKIINRYGSKENLQTALRRNGISNDKFKQDLVNELKIRKLINMLGSVSVTESEIKDFYKKNPDKFEYPEKVRASHILISANEKEIKDYLLADDANKKLTADELDKKIQEEMNSQKAKAEKILQEVKKNPKDFEKIARENSEDVTSGQKGGDLGFFAYNDMVEPFSKAAFSLKPNKVSDLVQTVYGYHIIIVKDRAKAGKLSYEKSKDEIEKYLSTEKQVKLLENLITQLKNNAKIVFVNEEFKPSPRQNEEKTKE